MGPGSINSLIKMTAPVIYKLKKVDLVLSYSLSSNSHSGTINNVHDIS